MKEHESTQHDRTVLPIGIRILLLAIYGLILVVMTATVTVYVTTTRPGKMPGAERRAQTVSPHYSAAIGDLNSLEKLLEGGWDVDIRDYTQATPLHRAAQVGCDYVAEELIERGADLEARNGDRMTPLAVAFMHGQPQVARLLLDKGADLMAKDEMGMPTYFYLGLYGHRHTTSTLEMEADLILEQGIDPNWKLPGGGMALMHMVWHDTPARVLGPRLLEAGGDINLRDDRGQTPLHSACSFASDDPEVIRYLIEHGANVTAADDDGKQPIHEAVNQLWRETDEETVRILVEHGADLNAKDVNGDTPLHWTVIGANPSGCRALVDLGADISVRNGQGLTPMEMLEPGNVEAQMMMSGAEPRHVERLRKVHGILREAAGLPPERWEPPEIPEPVFSMPF